MGIMVKQISFDINFQKLLHKFYQMTQPSPSKYSSKHLFELIKGRKLKEFEPYLSQIQNQTSEAEEAVSSVFRQILVDKMTKNPVEMFNTLLFYKHLLIKATMDYYCVEDVFPRSVHEEICNIITYKPEIKDLSTRAKTYFKDTIGAQISENNTKFAYNYILLATELLSAMASWYPTDFDDETKKGKSIFKQFYDQLVKKGIRLPQEKQFQILKEVDKVKFQKNYQNFLKLQEEGQQEEEKKEKSKEKDKKIEKPEIKPVKTEVKPEIQKKKEEPAVTSVLPGKLTNSTLNIVDNRSINSMINAQKKQLQRVSHQHSIPPKSQQMNIPKVLPAQSQRFQGSSSEQSNLRYEKNAKPLKNDSSNLIQLPDALASISNPSKLIDSGEKGIKSISKEKQLKIQQSSNVTKVIIQTLEQQKSSKISSQSVVPLQMTKGSTLNIQNQFTLALKKSYQQRSQSSPQSRKNPQKQEKKKDEDSKKGIQNGDSLKRSQKLLDNNIREPVPSNLDSPNKQQLKKVKTDSEEGLIPYEKQQKIPQSNRIPNSLDIIEINIKEVPIGEIKKMTMTPKKWPRIQKPSNQSSPHNIQNQINLQHRHNAQNAHFNEPFPSTQQIRPRSLPKTQKRKWQQFPVNFKYSSKNQQKKYLDQPLDFFTGFSQSYEPNLDHERDIFNKTLSYFATSRKKITPPGGYLEKYYTLASFIQKMKLDRSTLPFHVRYFEPITLAMTSLREEALNMFNSGVNSNPFYFSNNIQGRLLKEGDSTYLLSLQNISGDKLTISYLDSQYMKYTKRVKILSWGNQPQISSVLVPKGGYLDIKFQFQTYDLNFKFLPFSVIVNEKEEHLVLPITLLDMCEIGNQIQMNLLQKYAQKGSMIVSQAFRLKEEGLPGFLSGFKFSDLTARTQRSLLIGQCTIQFQRSIRDDESEIILYVMVRLIEQSSRKAIIQIIYMTKDGEAINLAKVLLYLLVFLMNDSSG